jgi:chemotaxis protein histidine kinase CheA
MLIAPRERRATESFEVEFCDYLKGYVPASQRLKKAKKAKKGAKKAAAAAKATATPKGAKKGGAKKTAAPAATTSVLVKVPSKTGKSLMELSERVAMARQAAAGLTRQQSATARKLADKGSLTHKWQYKDDGSKWSDYAPLASVEVEKMYANWLVNPHVDVRCVKSGDWEYMVDFNAMQQQNIKHQNHRVRQVQRIPVS